MCHGSGDGYEQGARYARSDTRLISRAGLLAAVTN